MQGEQRRVRRRALTILALCGMTLLFPALGRAQTVRVTVDRTKPTVVSKLELGVTHTQHSLDASPGVPANATAVAAAKTLLQTSVTYHCQSIMGWGPGNIEPSPGVYDWSGLDARIALIQSLPGAIPVITLCTAPGWMKGTDDWSMESAPQPAHYADFAPLCGEVAKRYRGKVKYYQVWNEFKGLWDAPNNNWDYVGYTNLYNQVYDAIKAVDPALKVGGPYLVLEGDGTDLNQWWGQNPITPRNDQVIDYWLKNKRGADFIVLDRGIVSRFAKPTPAQVMALPPLIGDICDQIRAKTSLPIWFAELYGWSDKAASRQMLAATMALQLRQLALHGAGVAFSWQPDDDTPAEWFQAMYTDTRQAGGGKAYPLTAVYKAFHQNFGPGTQFYQAASSSPKVEALASQSKTLLVNTTGATIQASVNGKGYSLSAYQVRLVPTP